MFDLGRSESLRSLLKKMKFKIFSLTVAALMVMGMTACGSSAHKSDTTDSATDTLVAQSDEAKSIDSVEEASSDDASDTKDSNDSKKYVPDEYGDCYIGERIRIPNDSGLWCEITFYPDGNCELKMENSSLKGTFTGEVKGSEYNIAVKFSNGEEYDFVGTKSKLVADDGLMKYVVEHEM